MKSDEALLRPTTRHTSKLPSYDRSLLVSVPRFGPDADRFMIYVTREAAAALCAGTLQQAPREAFGILMGRAYADPQGAFTIVTNVVYAKHLDAGAAHARLTPEQMAELRQEARKLHPAAHFVGWTHSHHYRSDYSLTDCDEQKKWEEDHNVGILTFMQFSPGEPWAVAYRGSGSRKMLLNNVPALSMSDDQTFSPRPFPSVDSAVLATTAAHQGAHNTVTAPRQKPGDSIVSWRNTAVIAFIAAWLIAIALMLMNGILLLGLMRQLTAIDHHLNALQPPPARQAVLDFNWSCSQSKGKTPLAITCSGLNDPQILYWIWNFGDGSTSSGLKVSHTYLAAGKYTVTLYVLTSTGTTSISSRTITVFGHGPSQLTDVSEQFRKIAPHSERQQLWTQLLSG